MTNAEALVAWGEIQQGNANPAAVLHATEVATYKMHERWDTGADPDPTSELVRWYHDAVMAYGKYIEDSASMEGVA